MRGTGMAEARVYGVLSTNMDMEGRQNRRAAPLPLYIYAVFPLSSVTDHLVFFYLINPVFSTSFCLMFLDTVWIRLDTGPMKQLQ